MERLVEIGVSVGLDGRAFGECVRGTTYRPWVRHVTESAAARGVTGTPSVLVAGERLPR